LPESTSDVFADTSEVFADAKELGNAINPV
jgi:hypothetical protein